MLWFALLCCPICCICWNNRMCAQRAQNLLPKGGAPGQDPTPRPPPPLLLTPKWLYGTMGFVGAGDFVLAIRQGELFCLTLCVYTQNT